MASNMEVDASQANVMASTATTGSVSVSLHPLVIMNVSEHWTRVKAQEGKMMQGNTHYWNEFCVVKIWFKFLQNSGLLVGMVVIFSKCLNCFYNLIIG